MTVTMQSLAHASCDRCGRYQALHAGTETAAVKYLTDRNWTHIEQRLFCPGCSKLKEGATA